MTIEGVPYFRYLVRYVTTHGRRRTKVLYSPGRPWIGEAVRRWIACEDIDVKRGSNVRISPCPVPASPSSPI